MCQLTGRQEERYHRFLQRLGLRMLVAGPVLVAVGVVSYWLGVSAGIYLAAAGFASAYSSLSVLTLMPRLERRGGAAPVSERAPV
jgi:hypothetical protein